MCMCADVAKIYIFSFSCEAVQTKCIIKHLLNNTHVYIRDGESGENYLWQQLILFIWTLKSENFPQFPKLWQMTGNICLSVT